MRNGFRWSIGLVLVLGMTGAWAEGGRIAFQGAVVEPTCAVETAPAGRPADERSPMRLACGQTSTDPGRSYSRTMVDLDATVAASDRLLNYFAGYANAPGGRQAKLIVRTYD